MPLTPSSSASFGALAYFRGTQVIGAGIGTLAGLDLPAAAESILVDASLNAGRVAVPAGIFQYELTASFAEGTIASLTDPGGGLGPHLLITSGGSFVPAILRVYPVPDMVTVANYSGGIATVQAVASFAVATTLSLISVKNNMKGAAGVQFDYILTIKQVGA